MTTDKEVLEGAKIDWVKLTKNQKIDLVAEKVMGWRRKSPGRWWADAEGYLRWKQVHFQPLDYWSAMREVVEEMQRQGWGLVCDTYPDQQSHARFDKVFSSESARAIGDTLPEAVCLAALRAKGVEIEGGKP